MDYKTYISSPQWFEFRRNILKQRGRRCQLCSLKPAKLHIHHIDYTNLGHEKDIDVIILCPPCHLKAHYNNKGETLKLTRKELYKRLLELGYQPTVFYVTTIPYIGRNTGGYPKGHKGQQFQKLKILRKQKKRHKKKLAIQKIIRDKQFKQKHWLDSV